MTAPIYRLLPAPELAARAEQAVSRLASCELCPRRCRVNRLEGQLGFCRTGRLAKVASFNLHFGEEAPLVGSGGSGTVFFGHCNLDCVFCQNWDISHPDDGEERDLTEVHANQLAWIMLEMERSGAHNINFVTPSHVVPQILEALVLAAADGLSLPLVYNCGGYESLETLALLDGVVDIYMPDSKFMSSERAKRFCGVEDYPERATAAIKEMHRQVGDLRLDARGVAERGLLVRHLAMPGDQAGTVEWLRFLHDEISPDTYLNIMYQYLPCRQAMEFPELSQSLSQAEYRSAVRRAGEVGLTRLDDRNDGLVKHLLRTMGDNE